MVGRRVVEVQVLHPRAARRHVAGDLDLAARLRGAAVIAARRRGKYLWMDLATGTPRIAAETVDPPDTALVVHLGMSGQMLVQPQGAPDETHLRIRARLDDGTELRFVDQRTFGGWLLDDYPPAVIGEPAPIPPVIAHIAPDPFDPAFDADAVVATMRGKHTEIKRLLLDQTVLSGVGNIYADEALWRARLHGQRLSDGISARKLRELLAAVTEVMAAALEVGGTSFDALYVNVNGQSGYFERSLNAYGREGLPCRRCGTSMRREAFMNRSSFSCPRCQPKKRVTQPRRPPVEKP